MVGKHAKDGNVNGNEVFSDLILGIVNHTLHRYNYLKPIKI